MRKLVAAALIGVMTMGLTVCGVSAADFDSSEDITVVSREDGSGTRGAFIEAVLVFRKSRTARKSI